MSEKQSVTKKQFEDTLVKVFVQPVSGKSRDNCQKECSEPYYILRDNSILCSECWKDYGNPNKPAKKDKSEKNATKN